MKKSEETKKNEVNTAKTSVPKVDDGRKIFEIIIVPAIVIVVTIVLVFVKSVVTLTELVLLFVMEIRVKNNKFRSPVDKNALQCQICHTTAGFYTLHTDALDDISTHHEPHFPQITRVLKPCHKMVRSTEERFAMERKEDRDRAGCAGGDNEALAAEAALGR